MAGELSLKTPLTGLVTLVPTNTATDKTITLPATTGTMVIQDGTNTTTVTNLAYTGTLTGGTGVVNLGSGQVYKDALGQLGIGTASPGYRLDVAAGDTTANFGYAIRLRSNATATAATLQFTNSGVTTENGYIRVTDTGLMSLSNKVYIDSSSNVGIGTATNLASSKLDVRGRVRVGSGNSSGDAEVIWSNYASATSAWNVAVRQDVGGANNDLKFLRFDSSGSYQGVAMQIDSAAGNVGIGTASPNEKITVVGAGKFTGSATTLDQPGAYIDYASNSARISGQGSSGGTIQFLTNPNGGFNTERMRLDSSGNLLVGTTTPAAFSTNTIVGTTTGGSIALMVLHNATDNAVRGIATKCPNYNGDDGYLYLGARSGGDVYYVKTNGNVLNINNSYGAFSDIKLKENIIDATPKLNNLNQVRVVSYNLKGEHQKQIGVIAQELEQIFPGMVDEMVDRDSEGNSLGTTTKAIKYSVFVPMLVKAIQELTARLEVLENK